MDSGTNFRNGAVYSAKSPRHLCAENGGKTWTGAPIAHLATLTENTSHTSRTFWIGASMIQTIEKRGRELRDTLRDPRRGHFAHVARFHVAGGRCGAKRDQICTGRTLFTSPTEQWARKTRYLPTAVPKVPPHGSSQSSVTLH